MVTDYMERTESISTRVDSEVLRLFKWAVYKTLEMQHSSAGKGWLSKSLEDAMKLYIRNYIHGELVLPFADLLDQIDRDDRLAKYLEQSGLTAHMLVANALVVYMQLPEETRKRIVKLQAENKMPINEAVSVALKS